MSFKNAVVLGAGPLGLMEAIEARQNFVGDVTLIDKRKSYTRLNVPTLDNPLAKHLKEIGVSDDVFGKGKLNEQSVPFHKIEDGLFKKASAIGIKVERGWTVEGLMGRDKNKAGRYKQIALTLRQWDDKGRKIMSGGGFKIIITDILVVSTGGAAAADPLVTNKLGFHFHKLAPTDIGAYGIFNQQTGVVDTDTSKDARALGSPHMGRAIALPAGDQNYLLVTLQNCSRADFKNLQSNATALKNLLRTFAQFYQSSLLGDIKDVEKNMAVFEISIQRAKQFYSPDFPAVLLGDAAVTPHPEQGSGISCGYLGFEKLQELFKALKKLDRSDNTEKAFATFNGAVEIIASKKALEGTRGVLKNNAKTLLDYINMIKMEKTKVSSQLVKNYLDRIVDGLTPLHSDFLALDLRAKDFLDLLADKKLQNSEMTIETFWRIIKQTYDQVEKAIGDANLMEQSLSAMESRFRT